MPPKRSDSRRTQATLIATAEQLFADRGIEAVSLSEINRLAGQRNKSALHYHFGSRDGLLKAILTKHRKFLDPRRADLIAEYRRNGELTLHDAVSVMVRPLAEMIDRDQSGIHYIRIMAQLSAAPNHPINDWLFNDLPPAFAEIAPVLYRSIPRLPTVVRMRRTQLMNGTMFHSLLLLTYPEDDRWTATTRELFVVDLIDCICGLIAAPESEQSAAVFDRAELTGLAPRAVDDVISRFGEGDGAT